MDAQRAFDRASRAARRTTLVARLRRRCVECMQLQVHDTRHRAPSHLDAVREIPVEAIHATVEPHRATQFDAHFRPAAKRTRARWERLWVAEQRGEMIPPISVVATQRRLRRRGRPPPRVGGQVPRRGDDRRRRQRRLSPYRDGADAPRADRRRRPRDADAAQRRDQRRPGARAGRRGRGRDAGDRARRRAHAGRGAARRRDAGRRRPARRARDPGHTHPGTRILAPERPRDRLRPRARWTRRAPTAT